MAIADLLEGRLLAAEKPGVALAIVQRALPVCEAVPAPWALLLGYRILVDLQARLDRSPSAALRRVGALERSLGLAPATS
jgi:hypothetical protein